MRFTSSPRAVADGFAEPRGREAARTGGAGPREPAVGFAWRRMVFPSVPFPPLAAAACLTSCYEFRPFHKENSCKWDGSLSSASKPTRRGPCSLQAPASELGPIGGSAGLPAEACQEHGQEFLGILQAEASAPRGSLMFPPPPPTWRGHPQAQEVKNQRTGQGDKRHARLKKIQSNNMV